MQIELTGDVTDSILIQSVMYFPDDEFLRSSWKTAMLFVGNTIGDRGERLVIDRRQLAQLVNAPSLHELEKKKNDSFKKGCTVGNILLGIYLMHICGIPEPSLNKAFHVMNQFGQTETFGDGQEIPRSRRTLNRYLNEYRAVSHLWAAYRLNSVCPYSHHEGVYFEGLNTLLSAATSIFDFGINFRPSRTKKGKPLIDEKDAWKLGQEVKPLDISSLIDRQQLKVYILSLLDNYDPNEYQIGS